MCSWTMAAWKQGLKVRTAGSRWTLCLWSFLPHDKQVLRTLLPPGGEQSVLPQLFLKSVLESPVFGHVQLLVCFNVDFWSHGNKECLGRDFGKFWFLNPTCFILNDKGDSVCAGAHPTCTQLWLGFPHHAFSLHNARGQGASSEISDEFKGMFSCEDFRETHPAASFSV